ncbi:hypothetical protein L7F22_015521 [Adiantum nelumboides]|nr:hypothetical protein [Adiantum nelumboides]
MEEGRILHNLVRENKKPEIETLLKEGRVAHIVDMKVDGKTALHLAACLGRTEIVELLIKVGHADIHACSDIHRDTPLHLAARFGHEDVVKKLLQQGAVSDLIVEDRDGDTPVHDAARSGKDKIIIQMLSVAPDGHACVGASNGELRTPLHYAAGSGNSIIVDILLQMQQALKEKKDKHGALPFHYAACSGDVDSLKMLAPSDVNVVLRNGLTALHYAAWYGRVAAVKKLMDMGATLEKNSDTPLHMAAMSKEPERENVVEAIITTNPESWKIENPKGVLAISLAHEHNHGDVVRAALCALRKSKPNLTGDEFLTLDKTTGASLLHFAAGYGTEDDIKWLAKALNKSKPDEALDKSKPDEALDKSKPVLDKAGRAPLHWAAITGNTNTLKELVLSLKADLTQKSNQIGHETPLFLALGAGHLNFAEELLRCDKERAKGDHSAKRLSTSEWMTGVDHWLKSYYESKEMRAIKDELQNGFERHTASQNMKWSSRINIGNGGGIKNMYEEIPPVYLALHAGKSDIAKFFQRLDEDAVNKKGTHTGRTALHWAVLLHRRNIVEQLCEGEPSFKERVRVCEEDAQKISPVQYATERNMQDIEVVLFKRDAVKDYIAGLYRDRQIYVDSTNAILVGAALIASVTFAGWLQPPLGFIDDYYNSSIHYVPMREVKGMYIFWIFNSLSFFAAVGTVQAGACGVLPLHHVHIRRAVKYIRRALMVASLLMAFSVVCVLGAFGAAGFIVLPPRFKFEMYMMITVLFGGLINVGLIFWFMQRILLAPRLFQLWMRHLPGWQSPTEQTLLPPDLPAPDKEVGKPLQQASAQPMSMETAKPSFPWNDKIEDLCK